jgi:hypothetical protein
MTFATHKCDYLKTKGTWGAKSPDDEKIVAMLAALNVLKGHLKLNRNLGDIIRSNGKGLGKGKGGNKKTKNKKNTGHKTKQKEDKAWRKVPPKLGKYTYHWCKHHMAWCMYKPSECCLGKEQSEEQQKMKSTYTANSATYTVAAASIIDPHFQAILATTGATLQGEDKGVCWCKPACIWAYLLACVAGLFYLDTGQLFNFIAYLLIEYLPMVITFICRSAVP